MVVLELTSARLAAETLMIDECTIVRDSQGGDDDTLNQTTGTLAAPDNDTSSVYTGKCHFHAATNVPRDINEGGDVVTAAVYEASIPHSATPPRQGDVFILTACDWDEALVGSTWRIRQTVVGTFNLRRRLILEERLSAATDAGVELPFVDYYGGY